MDKHIESYGLTEKMTDHLKNILYVSKDFLER